MVSHRLKGVLGVVAAGSLMLSSTATMASTPAPVQQVDPWAVLTAMSGGAPAAAMCGAAAAVAAQAPTGCVLPVVDVAPPPPPPAQVVEAVPPPPVAGGVGINPLFIALLAIAAGVGIFLAVHNNGNANSPA